METQGGGVQGARPLPPRRYVTRAEITHDPHAQPLRQDCGVAELERGPTGLMPDRLTMRCDEREIARCETRLREQRQHGAREPLTQSDVQECEIFRRPARDAIDDRAALRCGVRLLPE